MSIKEPDLSKDKAIVDFAYDLIRKLYSDYLLVNRICYKVKHQYRRQKQFQYLTQYKKYLHWLFISNKKQMSSKPVEQISKELFIDKVLDSSQINGFQRIILKIGNLMLEMLKLKLYPSYTIIIFGIMSRANAIFDYLNKNKEKITQAIEAKFPSLT